MRARRLSAALSLVVLASVAPDCQNDTFDLLPAENELSGEAGSSGGDGSEAGQAGAAGADEGPSLGGGPGVQPCGSDIPCEPVPCMGLDPAACVYCAGDQDCPGWAPECDRGRGFCVECLSGGECAPPERCDLLTGRCQRGCQTTDDCTLDQPLCDLARQVCVECVDNSHCQSAPNTNERFCAQGTCVECLYSEQCSLQRPWCWGFACVECVSAEQCWADRPWCSDFRCVECLNDAQCGVGQRCDSGECRH